jgi:hypothetical protein
MSNPNPNAGTEVLVPPTEMQLAQQRVQSGIVVGGQSSSYNLSELMELARVMAVAGLVPESLRGKPADVLIIIMKGLDLGLSPSQSIDAIHAIKGKATVGVHLAVARTRAAGHQVEIDETDDSCTVTITRKDNPKPISVTFTQAMAKRAGIKNEKYQSDPQSMLYARAATRCVRRACPEVLLGIFVEGEITDEDAQPQRPTLAQVAAEREDRPAIESAPAAPEPAAPTADDYAALEAEYAETVDPAPDFGGES